MKPAIVFVYGMQNADAPSAGAAALESLRESNLGRRPRLVALSPSAMSTGNYLDSIFDEAHIVPDPAEEDGAPFLETVHRISPRGARSVLLPGEAAAVPSLSALATRLEMAGIRVPLPPPPTCARALRPSLPEVCRTAGLPWCGDRIIVDGPAATAGPGLRYPLSVGPAQEGPELQVRSEAEFEAALRQAARDRSLPWAAREAGDRDEWSVGLVADAHSEVVMAGAVRVLLRSENRAVWIALTVSAPDLLELASRLARAIGWRGPLEVEFVRRQGDETPVLSRCIPCLPTWSLLASRAGCPLPRAAVAVAWGERCTPGRWRAGLLGAHGTEDVAVASEVYSSFVDSGTRRTP